MPRLNGDNMSKPRLDIIATVVDLARISNASKLDLSGKGLTTLPAAISQLPHLKSLDLSKNRFTEFPTEILGLKRLTSLTLSRNQIEAIPDSIGLLTQLQHLDVSHNSLQELPAAVGQLTRLHSLDLSNNRLGGVPAAAIATLAQLIQLDLSNNLMRDLPASVGLLTTLHSLNISFNSLASIPESIGALRRLESLGLMKNELKSLPDSIGKLTRLRMLYLSGNSLQELPDAIGSLIRLEGLFLADNRISALPDVFRNLARLRHLDLENNRLRSLPPWIGGLQDLSELYLNNNQLTELPEALRKASSLELLFLHDNDELKLPLEVLGPTYSDVAVGESTAATPSDMLDYYFQLRGGKRPLNEAKLILVGRGGVGKTSLVNRLVHNRFAPNEEKTEGICITAWPIDLPNSEEVRLNVWDFGGQEIMHATHQFFLTQRSLYLLVLTGREGGEDADAEYWLKLIDSFGDESPVIVVMNKIREHPFDLNRRALQQKYPIRAFVKTDCDAQEGTTEGFGIEELRKILYSETDKLEHLRDSFPASWFEIKNELAKMEKNYLTFEQFQEFCGEHGESDPRAQEALVSYLHNLGIVLNYRDDPRLQDTHVLNPHWVTNGIYKILNSEKLARQKGEIRLQDLEDILDVREYPVGMRRFIFDLMKKFDLCFSFPDDDSHYLVPELLDKQEPSETAEFRPDKCLNFQYHYPVLPEGLLPRLIVRTHVLSEGLPRWRSGVILRFDGNRALVKADVQDKRISISVLGRQSGRRRLLAVIRSDMERIHSDIKNLQPQEMVPLPGLPDSSVPYKNLQVMEQQQHWVFPHVVGDNMLMLSVSDLLNGVDLEGMRERK